MSDRADFPSAVTQSHIVSLSVHPRTWYNSRERVVSNGGYGSWLPWLTVTVSAGLLPAYRQTLKLGRIEMCQFLSTRARRGSETAETRIWLFNGIYGVCIRLKLSIEMWSTIEWSRNCCSPQRHIYVAYRGIRSIALPCLCPVTEYNYDLLQSIQSTVIPNHQSRRNKASLSKDDDKPAQTETSTYDVRSTHTRTRTSKR